MTTAGTAPENNTKGPNGQPSPVDPAMPRQFARREQRRADGPTMKDYFTQAAARPQLTPDSNPKPEAETGTSRSLPPPVAGPVEPWTKIIRHYAGTLITANLVPKDGKWSGTIKIQNWLEATNSTRYYDPADKDLHVGEPEDNAVEADTELVVRVDANPNVTFEEQCKIIENFLTKMNLGRPLNATPEQISFFHGGGAVREFLNALEYNKERGEGLLLLDSKPKIKIPDETRLAETTLCKQLKQLAKDKTALSGGTRLYKFEATHQPFGRFKDDQINQVVAAFHRTSLYTMKVCLAEGGVAVRGPRDESKLREQVVKKVHITDILQNDKLTYQNIKDSNVEIDFGAARNPDDVLSEPDKEALRAKMQEEGKHTLAYTAVSGLDTYTLSDIEKALVGKDTRGLKLTYQHILDSNLDIKFPGKHSVIDELSLEHLKQLRQHMRTRGIKEFTCDTKCYTDILAPGMQEISMYFDDDAYLVWCSGDRQMESEFYPEDQIRANQRAFTRSKLGDFTDSIEDINKECVSFFEAVAEDQEWMQTTIKKAMQKENPGVDVDAVYDGMMAEHTKFKADLEVHKQQEYSKLERETLEKFKAEIPADLRGTDAETKDMYDKLTKYMQNYLRSNGFTDEQIEIELKRMIRERFANNPLFRQGQALIDAANTEAAAAKTLRDEGTERVQEAAQLEQRGRRILEKAEREYTGPTKARARANAERVANDLLTRSRQLAEEGQSRLAEAKTRQENADSQRQRGISLTVDKVDKIYKGMFKAYNSDVVARKHLDNVKLHNYELKHASAMQKTMYHMLGANSVYIAHVISAVDPERPHPGRVQNPSFNIFANFNFRDTVWPRFNIGGGELHNCKFSGGYINLVNAGGNYFRNTVFEGRNEVNDTLKVRLANGEVQKVKLNYRRPVHHTKYPYADGVGYDGNEQTENYYTRPDSKLHLTIEGATESGVSGLRMYGCKVARKVDFYGNIASGILDRNTTFRANAIGSKKFGFSLGTDKEGYSKPRIFWNLWGIKLDESAISGAAKPLVETLARPRFPFYRSWVNRWVKNDMITMCEAFDYMWQHQGQFGKRYSQTWMNSSPVMIPVVQSLNWRVSMAGGGSVARGHIVDVRADWLNQPPRKAKQWKGGPFGLFEKAGRVLSRSTNWEAGGGYKVYQASNGAEVANTGKDYSGSAVLGQQVISDCLRYLGSAHQIAVTTPKNKDKNGIVGSKSRVELLNASMSEAAKQEVEEERERIKDKARARRTRRRGAVAPAAPAPAAPPADDETFL